MKQLADGAQPSAVHERSTGDLVKLLSEQVTVLVRDELKLAQVEMTRKGKQAGVGAGMLGGRLQKSVPPVPEHAVASIKTDVDVIKERARR